MSKDLLDYKRPFNIKKGLKQTFEHDFSHKNISKMAIIKMKNSDILTNRDLKIAEFLFKVRFATLNQIHRYLFDKGKKSNLKARLDKLVEYNVINRFVFCDDDRNVKETMQIYCLDIGGRLLLENYSTTDTTEWYSINNMKASNIIGKNLLITEWYIRLIETIPEKLVAFLIEPQLMCSKVLLKPEATFSIKNGEEGRVHFIVDVIRKEDINEEFQKRVERYESILDTNAWKKYFKNSYESPTLLILTEEEKNIPEIAQVIYDFTNLKKVRYSTDQRILKPLNESGIFLKFDPESEEKKITTSKILIFTPENVDVNL